MMYPSISEFSSLCLLSFSWLSKIDASQFCWSFQRIDLLILSYFLASVSIFFHTNFCCLLVLQALSLIYSSF
jgi:hypothetical protein